MGYLRVWDCHVHTAIFKMESKQDLLYSTRSSVQCCVAAWMGGEFGRERIMYVYGGLPTWLSGKVSSCQSRRRGFDLCVRKIPLEKEMATHSGNPVWEIRWTEEPGGLQAMRAKDLDMT